MKPSFLLAFAASSALLFGCTVPSAESIYDYQEPAHDGGSQPSLGAPSGDNAGNGDSADGSACKVQGSASVSGSLGGDSLAAKDAIEIFDPTKGTFTFLITDYADACSLGNAVHAGSNVVAIQYANTMLGSGTYDITQAEGFAASFTRYDSTCKASESQAADSGTITFRLDECGGEGSFDLVFGGEHVTASFTASVCATSTGAGQCQ